MGLIRKEDLHESLLNSLSNPNLLINGDFQVWQRGNSFTNVSNGYTADRWKIYSEANVNVSKTDNGLKFKPNVDWGYLIYCFDDETFNEINGKIITLTIKTTKGIMSKAFSFKQGDDWLELGSVPNISCIFSYRNKNLQFLINMEVDIEYIKLEYGNIATPFVPRLYGEELALCKRYYEVSNYDCYISGVKDNTSYFVEYKYDVEKRVPPTIECGNDVTKGQMFLLAPNNLKLVTPNSISPDTKKVRLNFPIQDNDQLNVGNACGVTGWIKIDAEIY